MRTQLISFETATIAKQNGVPQKSVIGWMNGEEKEISVHSVSIDWSINGNTACFDQVALQRWLREEKQISVEVNAVDDWDEWIARVYAKDAMAPFFLMTVTDGAETYEEAMEQGLLFAVKQLVSDEN